MPRQPDDGVYRSTVAAWKLAAPATIQERRTMKKVAQPEHAYTGYVPRWADDNEDELPGPGKRRNTPILGYKGHLRHSEDCIGTTFTRGVEIATKPGIMTSSDVAHETSHTRDHRHPAALGTASGYGAFAGASGYGQFQVPTSGYGAFEGSSGYGDFQPPPAVGVASGYGEFGEESGYGDFQAPPDKGGSGYGMFDGASGYGAFQAPPQDTGGSGYGEFGGASGYDQFLEAPIVSVRSNQNDRDHVSPKSPRFPEGSITGMRYAQAIQAVGGELAAKRLWHLVASTVSQRYIKRTELLQAVKRSFEKHERQSKVKNFFFLDHNN